MTDEKLPQDVNKKVEELRNWINRQAHLPKDLEDKLLLRFLHSCYYDIEKTKTTVELFFSIRSSTPELFAQRDLSNPALKTAFDILNVVQYEISGKRNIWLWQLNDPGLEKYDYVQDAKTFTLCFDAWLLENEEYAEEDIIILDVKDVTLRMITKLNLSVARKLSKYQEDAMPIRMKQIHVVNAPPFIDKVFSVMKPLLKQEITEMIHFHSPKSDSIFKFFKKEELPVDLGGYLPSADEYMKKTMQGVMDKRTRIIDENFWRVDKKAKNSDDVGTFRTLDID